MFWFIFNCLLATVLLAHGLCAMIHAIIDRGYQKLWYKEKAMRLKLDPSMTEADLCEYYVMFCKRNECRVDF